MSDGTDLSNAMEGGQDMSGGGAGTITASKPWMAQLPDNLKNNEILAGSDNIGHLAGRFLELHGKDSGAVRVPGEGATDEEKAKYLKAIGVPDAPDGYKMDTSNLPQSLSEDRINQLKADFHAAGLSQNQAQAAFATYIKAETARINADTETWNKEIEAANEALKTEWGAKFDENVAFAKKSLQRLGGDELVKLLESRKLANEPAMLRMWHTLGTHISEDIGINPESTGTKGRPRNPETGAVMFQEFAKADKV